MRSNKGAVALFLSYMLLITVGMIVPYLERIDSISIRIPVAISIVFFTFIGLDGISRAIDCEVHEAIKGVVG